MKKYEDPSRGNRVVPFGTDGQTDGHHEVNNRFSQFDKRAKIAVKHNGY